MTDHNTISPQQETIASRNGRKLHLHTWTASTPRGVLVVIHGFNAHGGLYDWTARQFAARGFAVFAPDLMGRGLSEGERYYVSDIADYVADVEATVAVAKARHPGLPVFLLGHSAGGVVSCTYALAHQRELAGLVCESFALKVPAPAFALKALQWLSGVAPHFQALRLDMKGFSRDPAVVAALLADPLIGNEKQPLATVDTLIRASQRLEADFAKITLPVFILHGSKDTVTMPDGSRLFHQKAGAADKTLTIYEGHAHDLLADIGREGVLEDIAAWIEARMPAAGAAHA